MTEAEEEKMLEDRLENWGRWLREGQHVGISNLWPILQRLPKAKDPMESSFTVGGDPEPVPVIDERDAIRVQRAWTLLPRTSLPDQEARALIGAVYAYPGLEMGRILSLVRRVQYSNSSTPIRLRPRDVDQHLVRARTMIKNILKRIDNAEK